MKKCLTISALVLLLSQSCEDSVPVIPPPPGTIVTFAGQAGQFDYSGDGGSATTAKLGWITGIAVDNVNNVYISDGASNTVRAVVRSSGTIITLAGTFLGFNVIDPTPYAGDGGAATEAHLNVPLAVDIDPMGNILIADAGNNVIRKASGSTGVISTAVGFFPGNAGYTGDTGPATQAQLSNPYAVAVDALGNIYIADSQNNVIRQIAQSTGVITTIAGLGPGEPGYTGDGGPANLARLNSPQGIAVDANFNVYISDAGNLVIRKISAGVISTIAGTGSIGYTGDNGPALDATLGSPKGLALDAAGNLYFADAANHAVRKVEVSTGLIRTVAGTGEEGFSGDGGQASMAMLSGPLGVVIDRNGYLLIADTGNSVIRIVY